MFVEIYPCDENGKDLEEESDAFVENPKEQVSDLKIEYGSSP